MGLCGIFAWVIYVLFELFEHVHRDRICAHTIVVDE